MGRVWTIEAYFRNFDLGGELPHLQITRYWISQWRGGELLNEFDSQRGKFEVFVEKFCDVNVALPYVVIIPLVGALWWFWERLDLKE